MQEMPDLSLITLDAAFCDGVRDIFETKIVFNQTLGLKIDQLGSAYCEAHILMKPQLVGHFSYNRLHGGVISAALDAMGALACMCAIGAQHHQETVLDRLKRFAKLSTVDLRVDYLRPAIGDCFILKANILRFGTRLACARMSICMPQGTLLSVATANYTVN